MIRVLLLNYEYPPLGGGGSNATQYLLQEMSARDDVDVVLVTSAADGRYAVERMGKNVTIHKLAIKKGSMHYWTQREVLSYSLKCRSFVRKLLKTERFDVCHAFFGIPCGAIAQRFEKKVPYLVSLRGSDVPGFNARFSLLYRVLSPIIRRVWDRAQAVVANSEDLRRLALKTDPNAKIEVILNGVDTREFFPAAAGRREAPAGTKRRLRLLCVSRLIERKGIGSLLRAMRLLSERGIDAELTVAGEGDLEDQLKELTRELGIGQSVHFLGYVPHGKLADLYRAHDAFILPSHNEGMSNAILEAMASGLAIITTDTGGIREISKDGETIIVPTDDADAIADAAASLRDDARLFGLQKSSRAVAEKMSWSVVADRYVDIYRKMAEKNGGRR